MLSPGHDYIHMQVATAVEFFRFASDHRHKAARSAGPGIHADRSFCSGNPLGRLLRVGVACRRLYQRLVIGVITPAQMELHQVRLLAILESDAGHNGLAAQNDSCFFEAAFPRVASMVGLAQHPPSHLCTSWHMLSPPHSLSTTALVIIRAQLFRQRSAGMSRPDHVIKSKTCAGILRSGLRWLPDIAIPLDSSGCFPACRSQAHHSSSRKEGFASVKQ